MARTYGRPVRNASGVPAVSGRAAQSALVTSRRAGNEPTAASLITDSGGAAGLVDLQSGGDPVTHLGDMADHANHAAAVAQGVEGVHHVVEGVGIQGTEALVDEEGADVGALLVDPGFLGDHVGQAQGEREGDHEGLAAGQGHRVAGLSRPLVADEQRQTTAGLSRAPEGGVLEGVALVGHPGKPSVGRVDHLAKTPGQHVGRQAHLGTVVGGLAFGEVRHPRRPARGPRARAPSRTTSRGAGSVAPRSARQSPGRCGESPRRLRVPRLPRPERRSGQRDLGPASPKPR